MYLHNGIIAIGIDRFVLSEENMGYLTYKRLLTEEDIDIPYLRKIYQLPEIARYISISENYFHYVTKTEDVFYYKVYDNDRFVGSIHLERQDAILYMDILVFPDIQRMGIGRNIVKDIQKDRFGLNYEKIEISIDETNIASINLFEGAGFIRVSKEDELINFVYQRRKTFEAKVNI